MIFITLGTLHKPFNRMVDVVKVLTITKNLKVKIVIQSGHTHGFEHIPGVEVIPFIQQNRLWKYMSQARVVCMHGGEGSILDAMEWCPNQPVLFPRNSSFGEHVDNYQADIVKSVRSLGWGIGVHSPIEAVDQIIKSLDKPKLNPMYRQKLYNKDLVKYLAEITSG